MSVAANIAHSYVPPRDEAFGWTPSPGAVLLAAFWPAAVFVAVEIMARASWAAGRGWVLVRWGGLAPVALVAAAVSYRHLAGLLAYYGEDPVTVAIGPLAVDGLMIVSTGALLAMAPRPAASTIDALDPLDPLDPTAPLTPVETSVALDRVAVDVPRPPVVEANADPASALDPSDSSADRRDERAVPARVVPLLTTADRSNPTPDVDYRTEDVERLKTAVSAGEIPWPIKYEPARKHLRINIKYVKAAVRQIDKEGWIPGQEQLLDA